MTKSFTRELILENSDAIDELIIDKLTSFFNSSITSLKKSISKKKYMLQKSLISDKIDERIFIYSNNFLGKRARQEKISTNIFKKTKWKIALHPNTQKKEIGKGYSRKKTMEIN